MVSSEFQAPFVTATAAGLRGWGVRKQRKDTHTDFPNPWLLEPPSPLPKPDRGPPGPASVPACCPSQAAGCLKSRLWDTGLLLV